MASLDIFNNDAFSVVSLTQTINRLAFKPGRIGELGLFSADRISTTMAMIESQAGLLKIVAPSPRGGVGVTLPKGQRNLRPLLVPHFEILDAVNADEVQNVRAFGSETELETVQGKVAQRQQLHVDSFAVTEEHARMGAIKGVVTYAPLEDGTASQAPLNLYTEFGVTKPPVVQFDLDAASDGSLLRLTQQIKRQVGDKLAGAGFNHIHAFVGDEFFDGLLTSAEVRASYEGTTEAAFLRDSYINADQLSWGAFVYGGVIFENYRGSVGTEAFIEDDEARFFPVGVPGLFKTVYAPADYIETVNTLGERLYTKQWPSPNGKRIELESQMNALQYCSRPEVLIEGRIAA